MRSESQDVPWSNWTFPSSAQSFKWNILHGTHLLVLLALLLIWNCAKLVELAMITAKRSRLLNPSLSCLNNILASSLLKHATVIWFSWAYNFPYSGLQSQNILYTSRTYLVTIIAVLLRSSSSFTPWKDEMLGWEPKYVPQPFSMEKGIQIENLK